MMGLLFLNLLTSLFWKLYLWTGNSWTGGVCSKPSFTEVFFGAAKRNLLLKHSFPMTKIRKKQQKQTNKQQEHQQPATKEQIKAKANSIV